MPRRCDMRLLRGSSGTAAQQPMGRTQRVMHQGPLKGSMARLQRAMGQTLVRQGSYTGRVTPTTMLYQGNFARSDVISQPQ